jgi:hypothetical protein
MNVPAVAAARWLLPTPTGPDSSRPVPLRGPAVWNGVAVDPAAGLQVDPGAGRGDMGEADVHGVEGEVGVLGGISLARSRRSAVADLPVAAPRCGVGRVLLVGLGDARVARERLVLEQAANARGTSG